MGAYLIFRVLRIHFVFGRPRWRRVVNQASSLNWRGKSSYNGDETPHCAQSEFRHFHVERNPRHVHTRNLLDRWTHNTGRIIRGFQRTHEAKWLSRRKTDNEQA